MSCLDRGSISDVLDTKFFCHLRLCLFGFGKRELTQILSTSMSTVLFHLQISYKDKYQKHSEKHVDSYIVFADSWHLEITTSGIQNM